MEWRGTKRKGGENSVRHEKGVKNGIKGKDV
jgi:hypothetical protein